MVHLWLYISFIYFWLLLLESHEYNYKFISHLSPDEQPLCHLASPKHEFKNAAGRIDDNKICGKNYKHAHWKISNTPQAYGYLCPCFHFISQQIAKFLDVVLLQKEIIGKKKFIPPLTMLEGKLWPSSIYLLWTQQIIYRYKTSYRCLWEESKNC